MIDGYAGTGGSFWWSIGDHEVYQFETQQGEIFMSDKLVSSSNIHLDTGKRNIGFLFQDYALFPHLTVKQNLKFAMKNSKNNQEINEITKLIKLTKIMDYQIDFSPEGSMLLIQNKDIPGVVGKIGTVLGSFKINIAEFLLSRKDSNDIAYSIIKIDGKISDDILNQISKVDEIIDIKQITING